MYTMRIMFESIKTFNVNASDIKHLIINLTTKFCNDGITEF